MGVGFGGVDFDVGGVVLMLVGLFFDVGGVIF